MKNFDPSGTKAEGLPRQSRHFVMLNMLNFGMGQFPSPGWKCLGQTAELCHTPLAPFPSAEGKFWGPEKSVEARRLLVCCSQISI